MVLAGRRLTKKRHVGWRFCGKWGKSWGRSENVRGSSADATNQSVEDVETAMQLLRWDLKRYTPWRIQRLLLAAMGVNVKRRAGRDKEESGLGASNHNFDDQEVASTLQLRCRRSPMQNAPR